MRGQIDFRLGFSNLPVNPSVISVGAQEATFWFWRVSAIRLQINLSLAGHAPIVVDRTYTIPKSDQIPIDLTPRTEFDQIFGRKGWSILSEMSDPEPFGLGFAGLIEQQSADPTLYDIFTFFEAFTPSYSTGNVLPGMVLSSVAVSITGFDSYLGKQYGASIPMYEPSGGPFISGTVEVTPYRYYRWVDALGNPLYDETTGARIPQDDE